MENYKKMYYTLFNNVSNIIEELQKAQMQTEEMYMSQQESFDKEEERDIGDT